MSTNVLSETLALAQVYKTRDRMDDNAAYRKAEQVLELRDELIMTPGYDHLSVGDLLAAAEDEYQIGEAAMAEPVERYVRTMHVECRPLLGGFELIQGSQRIQVPAHAVDRILDTIGQSRAQDRRAAKARRRQAEGRAPFRVVGGRLANEQAA